MLAVGQGRHRDGRRRRALRVQHQSARQLRAGPRARRRAPARNWPISNSCSSTRPRSMDRRDPMPLVSEAVRGEGAILIDETGRALHGRRRRRGTRAARCRRARDLAAPRRGPSRLSSTRAGRSGERFATRFPLIAALCAQAGIDPARQPIPVRPAAHYHMGGVAVDADGAQLARRPLGLRRGGVARACTAPIGSRAIRLSEAVVFAGVVAEKRRGGVGRAPRRAARGPARRRRRPSRAPRAADPVARRRRDARGAKDCARRSPRWRRSRATHGAERRSGGGRADDRRRRVAAPGKPRRALPHGLSGEGERAASRSTADGSKAALAVARQLARRRR